ncbi:MAG: D-glycero-beta-D-manno-heptose 1-phosphate adenylyltransferase [Saprospiraceae bacterium]
MLVQIQSKIQNWQTAANTVHNWQRLEQKVVFTNGCFDLLHYGHLHYLAEARSLGDRLVIGLNATESVRRLKGKHRPIHDVQTRRMMLAALIFVDLVVEFSEDTPFELIKLIQPNLLVKGGDYQIENIVGADIVTANGGIVKTLPFIKGYSTTKIEEKIKKQY